MNTETTNARAVDTPTPPDRCACGEIEINRVHHETRLSAWHPFAATPAEPLREALTTILGIVEEASGSLPSLDRAAIERLVRAALANPSSRDITRRLLATIDALRAGPSRSSPDPDPQSVLNARDFYEASHRNHVAYEASRLGSSPDLTGLDNVVPFEECRCESEFPSNCGIECNCWHHTAILPPAPETDSSQVEG